MKNKMKVRNTLTTIDGTLYENDDDEYIDEHWDMIDEEKWSCVEAARNGLNNEK